MDIEIIAVIRTISQILTAGVAITAISLFLYASAFNFQDRVARSFAAILACIVAIFSAEAIADVSANQEIILLWLNIKWFGLVLLPATYFHFSDALLTLTGKPSRGRRKLAVLLIYIISFSILLLIPTYLLVGNLSVNQVPVPYLERTILTNGFIAYFGLIMLLSGYNLIRAIKRARTTTSQRRLIYLLIGAGVPAIAIFPFLLHGIDFFIDQPMVFWVTSILGSAIVGLFIVLLAYAVAFFGVTWTDRVVKSRLFKWLMRGPFVALTVLGITTIIRRVGEYYGDPYSAYVPISMVAGILILEYIITLMAPLWEKWLFYGAEREDLFLIRSLEDHLLTRKDLDQFLEIIVASICDRIQVPGAFIAVINGDEVEYFIQAGDKKQVDKIKESDEIITASFVNGSDRQNEFVRLGELLLMPLYFQSEQNGQILLGISGFPWPQQLSFEYEHINAVKLLNERATLALKDRRLQQQVLDSLIALQPQVNYIQKLRAISNYDQTGIMTEPENFPIDDFSVWVKDALLHFWGGPKLTESPLLNLKVVKAAAQLSEGNYSNALRTVLRQAIDVNKPKGDRRFTAEWIIYNILEMKFLEGKKVKEIASKLAVSEADLYRKQRIAIESVAKAIIEMEKVSFGSPNGSETNEVVQTIVDKQELKNGKITLKKS